MGVGYQRVLNEARAKRLSEYLLDGQKEKEAFLPTSIFLATDKLLPFDEVTNTITIDTEKTGAFNVVDLSGRPKPANEGHFKTGQ